MKKYILLFILVCAIIGLIIWISYSKPTKDESNTATQEQEQQIKTDLIAKQLSDKYQANVNWDQDIKYTLQLQEKLMNGKPTLFKGNIEDIFTRDNKFFIKLSSNIFNPYFSYTLELDCDKKIVDEIENKKFDPYGFSDNYIAIAYISNISKPELTLPFTINGTCLDIVYLGEPLK